MDVPGLVLDDSDSSDEILEDITEIGTRWKKFLSGCYTHDWLGDAYANTYTWVLETSRDLGLPGDNGYQYPWSELRFSVERRTPTTYEVNDRMHNICVEVSAELLQDNSFQFGRWYAQVLMDRVAPFWTGMLCDEFYNARVQPTEFNARMHLKHKLTWDETLMDSSFTVSACGRNNDCWYISEDELETHAVISGLLLRNEHLHLASWYAKHSVPWAVNPDDGPFLREPEYDTADLYRNTEDLASERWADMLVDDRFYSLEPYLKDLSCFHVFDLDDGDSKLLHELFLFGVQIDRDKLPALQRNASVVKDKERAVPSPVVVTVQINGKPAKALLDSGSLGDFMSSTLADQLGSKTKVALAKPIPLQLAVQGSRTKINWSCKANISYQTVDEERAFDVINISSYDLILGTPFMYQHRVLLGLNPARVVVGSKESLPMDGPGVSRLASMSVDFDTAEIVRARQELLEYAKPLCKTMDQTDLPPLRAINHTIPLIDEKKVYKWRPSRCPEPLLEQWVEKRNAYLKSGRWQITTAGNAVPMLHIYKPGTKLLRIVVDLRERNANTVKMSTPMPNIEAILRRIAAHLFRSSMDGKDAYEQIRIVAEHVARSAMTTPDGTMVSLVMQQGDCNAPATYQALMNHIFAPYIGVFMDVYLDDIIIYSDTLEKHIQHVKTAIDVLTREKLYLSEKKLHFLEKELKVLGHIVDESGIRMDPHKVDAVVNWKTPTNRDLLRGFLGAVGYLADDVAGVRIPMGVLARLTGDNTPFRWTDTHQRSFDEVKLLVDRFRSHSRRPLSYARDSDPIWLITDGSATGVAGVVSQGKEWRTARVAAFFSAKLNPAQQNYPVHEIEMLAGLESMLRHRDILQGVHFRWLTDHKGLVHLLNQPNLSGRQARWLEKMSEFDFTPVYIPGTENVLSDALSRIYANDAPGTERAASEFVKFDEDSTCSFRRRTPVIVGDEARLESMPLEGISLTLNAVRRGGATESRDFAKRMVARKFVLRGPRERTEGGNKEEVNQINNGPTTINSLLEKEGVPGAESNLVPVIGADEALTTVNSELSPRNVQLPPPSTQDKEPSPTVSIVNVVSHQQKRDLNVDFMNEIRNNYMNDTFMASIVNTPRQYKNFTLENGLLYLVEGGRRLLCIPDAIIGGRTAKEIVIDEGHSLLAHLGPEKTLTYLREFVWWRHLSRDVYRFCESCRTCARSKPSNHRPYGLLRPLPIPSRPWDAIGIDFVGPLPKSADRNAFYDSITVIIDLLTAMVHLVPSRTTYGSVDVAELIFAEVYKHHGLPRRIVSDRDPLFTARFWQKLHELIGTKLNMSSAYHPQSDGSTERANRTITQMIRQCVNENQKDWVRRLPAIEFAINSARTDSTGFAPFFLNTGRMPRPFLWDTPSSSESKGVREFAEHLREAVITAHDAVLASRTKQIRDANRHRQPSPFQIGDLVYVSTKNISFPQGLARKLIPKYMGPYRINRAFGNDTFQIELPNHLVARGVHPSFHASLLRVHIPNDDRLFPGRSLEHIIASATPASTEWNIREILSHSGVRQHALFEILWPTGDRTWLPYHKVSHLEALRRYFETLGICNIEELPRGSGTPPNDPQIVLGCIKPASVTDDGYLSDGEIGLDSNPTHPNNLYSSNHPHITSMSAAELGRLHPIHTALTRNPEGSYSLRDLDSRVCSAAYTRDELISFVSANRRIISGTLTNPLSLPPRYIGFATLYNKQGQITTKFNLPHGHAFTTRIAGPGLRFLGLVAARPSIPRKDPRNHYRSQTSHGRRATVPPNYVGQSRPTVGQSSNGPRHPEAGEFILTAERHDVVTNLLLDMVMGNKTPTTNFPPVRESPAVRRSGASLRRSSTPYARPKKVRPTIVPTNPGSSPSSREQKISGIPVPDVIPNADKPRETIPINTCPSPSESDIELVNTPSSASSDLATISEDVDMNDSPDKPSASPTSKVPTVELADLSISKDPAAADGAA
ncbi:hypothetical protein CCMSSC00406_0000541 [Pleurotus cornucopiae]|uniref:Uncharacterized protein n=2 Tax=Pleurotus cornucopiae TaxID=5321 RepID=A0ACB7IX90_PLECO|nr:hypothetical protein CCMSSC00406_0002916 [Pleurotus cornucopiae]KAG9222770.1 hypothetical protein CCMSSC00406_0000541 [Pleurotus cornucopiae]